MNMANKHFFGNGAVGFNLGVFNTHFDKVVDCSIVDSPYRLTCYAIGKADEAFHIPAKTEYKSHHVRGFLTLKTEGVFFCPGRDYLYLFRTRVLFKDIGNGVLAVFPDLIGSIGEVDSMTCRTQYMETPYCYGKHVYRLKTVTPVNDTRALELHRALVAEGYKLEIVSRMPSNSRRLREFQVTWGNV